MPRAKEEQKGKSVLKSLRDKLGRAPIPRMEEVAAEFIDLAGGPKNFASLLWQEFTSSPKGSLIRQRTFDLVLKCMKGADSRITHEDLDHLSDDEMDAALAEAMKQAGVRVDGTAAAGPATPAPAGVPAAEAEAREDGREEAAEGEPAGGRPGPADGAAAATAGAPG